MKKRRRAVLRDSPPHTHIHTPRRTESLRRLKGYAKPQDSCLPLAQGPRVLVGMGGAFLEDSPTTATLWTQITQPSFLTTRMGMPSSERVRS